MMSTDWGSHQPKHLFYIENPRKMGLYFLNGALTEGVEQLLEQKK